MSVGSSTASGQDEVEYIILSLNWSGETLVWYKPKSSGYTSRLDLAGRYSAQEAARITRFSETAVAVPLAMAEAAAVRIVTDDYLWRFTALRSAEAKGQTDGATERGPQA